MKKVKFQHLVLLSASFLLFSCESTSNVESSSMHEQKIQIPEETDTQKETEPQENPLTHIIEQNVPKVPETENHQDFSGTGPVSTEAGAQKESDFNSEIEYAGVAEREPEVQSAGTGDFDFEQAEIVSAEDSIFQKGNETAPTQGVSDKVVEPAILDDFSEPVVIDLQESEIDNEISSGPVVQTAPGIRKTAEALTGSDDSGISIEAEPEVSAVSETPSENENHAEKEVSGNSALSETTDGTAADSQENVAETETEENDGSDNEEDVSPKPSRAVTIKRNQYLDVVYPGSGWVYIGEAGDSGIIKYFGRRIGTGNTTFSVRSVKSGTTLLHFYKNDALTGEYIDDYLEVTVEEEALKGAVRAKAPSYAEIVPSKPVRREISNQKPQAKNDKVIENTAVQEKSENPSAVENAVKTQPDSSKKPQKYEKALPEVKTDSDRTAEKPNEKPEISEDVKTVISTPEDSSKTAQKSAAAAAPKKENLETRQPSPLSSSSVAAVSQTEALQAESSSQNIVTEEEMPVADESLLERALKLYEENKFEESLKYCQVYLNGANTRLDEAYYLLGELYESEFGGKNIRNSIDAYETVTRKYPLSKLWKKANKRAIYLKRFFIDIR